MKGSGTFVLTAINSSEAIGALAAEFRTVLLTLSSSKVFTIGTYLLGKWNWNGNFEVEMSHFHHRLNS